MSKTKKRRTENRSRWIWVILVLILGSVACKFLGIEVTATRSTPQAVATQPATVPSTQPATVPSTQPAATQKWTTGSAQVNWATESRHQAQVCVSGQTWDMVETTFAQMEADGVDYQGLWPGADHEQGLVITGTPNPQQGFFTAWATVTGIGFMGEDGIVNVAYLSTEYNPGNLQEVIWKASLQEMLEAVNTASGTEITASDVQFVFQVPWDYCTYSQKVSWELIFTTIRHSLGIVPTPYNSIYGQFQMPNALVVTEITQNQ